MISCPCLLITFDVRRSVVIQPFVIKLELILENVLKYLLNTVQPIIEKGIERWNEKNYTSNPIFSEPISFCENEKFTRNYVHCSYRRHFSVWMKTLLCLLQNVSNEKSFIVSCVYQTVLLKMFYLGSDWIIYISD